MHQDLHRSLEGCPDPNCQLQSTIRVCCPAPSLQRFGLCSTHCEGHSSHVAPTDKPCLVCGVADVEWRSMRLSTTELVCMSCNDTLHRIFHRQRSCRRSRAQNHTWDGSYRLAVTVASLIDYLESDATLLSQAGVVCSMSSDPQGTRSRYATCARRRRRLNRLGAGQRHSGGTASRS